MATELAILENQLKAARAAPRDGARQARAGRAADADDHDLVRAAARAAQMRSAILFNSAMSAAVLGLEVDGVTGQAYLIPFAGKAQLVIGYKGFNTLAARSGITITGAVVREGDEFDFELGSNAAMCATSRC
jgi:phage RecT family recombinase